MFDADYGFEYSDEDVQEEDVDIENQYYNSKGRPFQTLCMFQPFFCAVWTAQIAFSIKGFFMTYEDLVLRAMTKFFNGMLLFQGCWKGTLRRP